MGQRNEFKKEFAKISRMSKILYIGKPQNLTDIQNFIKSLLEFSLGKPRLINNMSPNTQEEFYTNLGQSAMVTAAAWSRCLRAVSVED